MSRLAAAIVAGAALLVLAGAAAAERAERLPAIVHLHSDLTTGDFPLEALAGMAQAQKLGALLVSENYLVRVEYGLPPFRALTRVTHGDSSVLDLGIDRYLARVAEVRAQYPGLVILAGVEVMPHYHWTGSPLALEMQAHNTQKNLLVWGLDAAALARLPVVGNPAARVYALDSVVEALPALLLLPGVIVLARKRPVRQRVGRAVMVVRRRQWLLGAVLCGIAAFAITRAWPFTVDRYPPWRDFGVAPYQALIDEVNAGAGITAWSFPEARDEGERMMGPVRVTWRTDPYPDDLLRTFRYTAFGGVYEDTSRFERPGAGWDRALAEYVAGERSRPARALGESGFHGLSAGKRVGLVQTVLLDVERSEAGVLDAIREGRAFALRRSPEFALSLGQFVVAGTEGAAAIGGTLRANVGAPVEVRVAVDADRPGRDVRITLVKNGAVVEAWSGPTPFRATHREDFDGRPAYFRLDVGGPSADHRILTNPIFVRPAS
ncbi:MAG TPA: hypothetical protein VGU22_05620 [Methylomirabilota bacterium]|nr:hypothetical protein [Methylomirabilota bacterium]